MLRYVSPPQLLHAGAGSYQQATVRRGAGLSLGIRIGLATALNDHQGWRLTGSLPLVQKSFTGVVIVFSVFGFFVSRFAFRGVFPFGGNPLRNVSQGGGGGAARALTGRGWTIRPMAHTNPLNSRPNAAAATGDFLCITPVKCW